MEDFFRVINSTITEEGNSVFEVALNAEHEVYQGHFPGMPVTPGVCTLDIVKRCASEVMGRELRYDSIRDCKFLDTIIPDKDKRITVKMSTLPDENGLVKLNCEVLNGEKVVMKLKAIMIQA